MIKSRHRKAHREGRLQDIPLDILQEIEAEEMGKLAEAFQEVEFTEEEIPEENLEKIYE